MTCARCGQPASDAYHPACWRARVRAIDERDRGLHREALAAIHAARAGGLAWVSTGCWERYGAQIAHSRRVGG